MSRAITSAVAISIAGALVPKLIWKEVDCPARTADEGSFMPHLTVSIQLTELFFCSHCCEGSRLLLGDGVGWKGPVTPQTAGTGFTRASSTTR